MTVVFQTFPGQRCFFLQTFQGIFSTLYEKTLKNWVLNNKISHTANSKGNLTYDTVRRCSIIAIVFQNKDNSSI